MRYYTISPSDCLRDFIRCFWVLESDLPYTHYSMADVCPELIFHYDGLFDEVLEGGKTERSFTSGIHGPGRHTRRFQIARSFGIFGVYFYPHAIPLLFDLPAEVCTDDMVGLTTWSKNLGGELEEKIMGAQTNPERATIVSEFVMHRLSRHRNLQLPVFKAINHIIHHETSANVKQLAANYCLSERQLERQFRQFTGMAPKLFCRIARFHTAMSFYGDKQVTLTEIALHCGYYDQSHFIHDFKAFSDHHPKAYFAGLSPATAWRG